MRYRIPVLLVLTLLQIIIAISIFLLTPGSLIGLSTLSIGLSITVILLVNDLLAWIDQMISGAESD